jgi:hypothetical protein
MRYFFPRLNFLDVCTYIWVPEYRSFFVGGCAVVVPKSVFWCVFFVFLKQLSRWHVTFLLGCWTRWDRAWQVLNKLADSKHGRQLEKRARHVFVRMLFIRKKYGRNKLCPNLFSRLCALCPTQVSLFHILPIMHDIFCHFVQWQLITFTSLNVKYKNCELRRNLLALKIF